MDKKYDTEIELGCDWKARVLQERWWRAVDHMVIQSDIASSKLQYEQVWLFQKHFTNILT